MNNRLNWFILSSAICAAGGGIRAAPTVDIRVPNGGADTTVYTNKVVLWGKVDSDLTLKSLGWTNATAGSGGTGTFEWVQGGTSGWWRTPAIALTSGVQTLGVWALATNNAAGPTDTVAIAFDTGGLPADLANYPTGAVFATALQANRQESPATLGNPNPAFSWRFGDALNTAIPTNLSRMNLGSTATFNSHAIAVADLTGDGRPDVVIGNDQQQSHVLINDGGNPSNWPRVTLGDRFTAFTYSVAVGDVTGDGRPDVVMGNRYGDQSYVLVNNGSWPDTWARIGLADGLTYPTDMAAIGDLTGDGRPDVVLGNEYATSYVLVNNGGAPNTWARYALGAGTPPGNSTFCVAIGDVTGDGLADVVVANNGQQSYVAMNNGGLPNTWARTNLPTSASSDYTCTVALGDVNGDGWLDIVIGNSGQSYLLLNNRTAPAGWTKYNLPAPSGETTYAAAIADFNGDGRPDVLMGNSSAKYLLVNNGGLPSTWARYTLPGAPSEMTYGCAVGDVSGDGRPDVVVANYARQNYVMLNTAAVMPATQTGYELHVARTTADLPAGPWTWDSGVTNSPVTGDGAVSVRQMAAGASSGDYYWNLRLFSSSGYQSLWTDPQRYTIPTNRLLLSFQQPVPPRAYVTNTPYAVRGWVSWEAASLTWTNMTSGVGGAIGTFGTWTQTVALAAGDNDLRVVAGGTDGSSVTQSVLIVYLTNAPRLEITTPNGGLDQTTTYFSVQMAGLLTEPADSWGTAIYWSNAANNAVGAIDRANGQMLWPASGTATIPLQRDANNAIRVWCYSKVGGAIEDLITVGCFDPVAPTIELLEPNGGADTTVYTNAVVLAGSAADNGTLARLIWTNLTAGTSGTGVFEWVQSGTNGAWRTPPLPLAPGSQQLAVWVMDAWDHASPVKSIAVTYVPGGLPADLEDYPTGAVFATGLQVNRACSPTTIDTPYPRYSWLCGDALNVGSPTNMLRVNLGCPNTNATQAIAIGDVTGDGRPDVVVGNFNEQNYVLVNDGGNPTNWPRVTLGNLLDDYTYGLAISDVTGDGRADAIVRNYGQDYLLVNTGTSPDTWPRIPLGDVNYESTCSLAVGELNGDGRPDVVIGCAGRQSYVLLNTGTPTNWVQVSPPVTASDSIWGVAVGDVTGDGRADLLTASQYRPNLVLVNNGGSLDTWPRVTLGSPSSDDNSRCVAIGDLTGDGRPDVVVGNYQQANYVLVNDGGSPSNWPRVTLASGPAYITCALAIGDVTGDGRPDVTVGINGQQSYVAVNNGGSPDTWARVALGNASAPATMSIALGDINGDGRPDVVLGNANGQNHAVLSTPAAEPYGQAGYRIQVAQTPGALTAGPLSWDSTAMALPDMGDGCGGVRQSVACTAGGDHYWRVKTFSSSGFQSEWSPPQKYTIPTNLLYLTIDHPVPPGVYVTNTPCAVTGWTSWNATYLAWTNLTTGTGGLIATPGAWTQTVSLAAATNRLRFTARAAGGLASTQTLTLVYLPSVPHIDITSPHGGVDYSTTDFSVPLAGTLSAPLDSWGLAVYWNNRATGAMGTIGRTNGQSLWPATGTATVALQPWTDNVIRVWCDSQVGGPLDATITVGCYDSVLPIVAIGQPNGGADVTVYTNRIALTGGARDNGTLVSVGWTNLTAKTGGSAQIEWNEGGTNAAWRTPILNLSTGAQQFAVWAVDSWNNTSVVDSITVTFSAGGVPTNLADFATGVVFATSLQAERQWPPVPLSDTSPSFSWLFGDAINGGSPTGMVSTSMATSIGYIPGALAIGDVTGDGRPDIVVGHQGTQSLVLVNTSGSVSNWLRVALGSPLKMATYGIALGDLTGDGRPDVVLGNASTQNVVMINNGASPETWERINLGSRLDDDTRAVAIADMTGDGRPDVVVGNHNVQSYVLVNNGGNPAAWPRVNLASGAPFYPIWSLAVGDVTGDGRPDVVLGNISQQNIVLVNNGGSPTNWARVALGSSSGDATRSVALADFNGDGRLDVAVGNSSGQQNVVLLNNGGSPDTWQRTNLGSTSLGNTMTVAAGDITGDGRPDVFAGNFTPETAYVMVNNGGAPNTWARTTLSPASPANAQVGAIGDLTGDGRPDIACNNGQDLVFVNTPSSMPMAQVGYRVQVARSEEDLESGILAWDSGIVPSPDMGDGLSRVRQAAACTNAGAYYWRVKTFSASGCQSGWSDPRRYTIPADQLFLSLFRPVAPRGYVAASPYPVTGWVSWNATNLVWTNSATRVGGRIAVPGVWTQTVALAAGSNALTFVASAAGGLAATQAVDIIYLTNAPALEITVPQGGQAFTSAFPTVQLAGFVTPATPNWWAYTVCWSNAATGTMGYMARTNGQPQWPASGTQTIALQRNTDNVIRVWCDSLLGEAVQDTITIGSYDPQPPTVQILQPNGGADGIVYTNKVVLWGVARDNGPLGAVLWSNLTTGAGGPVQVDRNDGDSNFWWRTPVLTLAPGSQQFRAWAVDSWGLTSAFASVSVTYDTNGTPAALGNYPQGAVFATSLAVNRQFPPTSVTYPYPQFSWQFGDAINTGSPAAMVRVALSSLTNFAAYGLAWGDLTGDGMPDAVAGNNNKSGYVMINNGDSPANWAKVTLGSPSNQPSYGVALGDVTGDGRPDVAVANYNEQNYVLINNGTSPSNWARYNLGSALKDASWSVALGDVTGDGRLDAVVGNRSAQNYVLINNGNTPSNWPRFNLGSPSNDSTCAVAIGDFNGDGRADVAVGNYNEPSYVLINDGSNPTNWIRWTLGSPANRYTYSLAVGDLNGDGRLDVVLGNSGQQSCVLLNDGWPPPMWSRVELGVAATDYAYGIAIGDVTGDGRPDVAITEGGQANYVVVNNGGTPSSWPRVTLGPDTYYNTRSVVLGDITGDGRMDALIGANSGQSYTLVNVVTSMPCAQVGYRVQVARSPTQLAAGDLSWDSGIVSASDMGDGLGSVRQTVPCVSAGPYYWRVRTFSSSGYQSGWTEPSRFDVIPPADAPFVDITNDDTQVTAEVTLFTIGGTNNAFVTGTLWWTNSLTGAGGTLAAVSPWSISNIVLGIGANTITVGGSNSTGFVAIDTVTILRPGGDSDEDGLPDWWETLYFGGPTNAAPNADPDGDAASNFREFLAGTIPTNGESCLRLLLPTTPAVPGSTGIVVRWLSETGRYYRLDRSTNLIQSFSDFRSNIFAVPPMNTETDTTAIGKGPYFFRVMLEP